MGAAGGTRVRETPEAQVAEMIKKEELDGGHTAKVIEEAKAWVKKNLKHPLMPQVLLLQEQSGGGEVRGQATRVCIRMKKLATNYPDVLELYPARFGA